jgi:hypothetical protein
VSLQRETARNGQPIFKIDGRSIVSSFDPMKEARGWVENAVKEIGDRDTVIVLGAGCGYHLIALRELRPTLNILTIEASADIASFAREQLSSNDEIDPRTYGEILVAERPIELTDSMILRDFMANRYAVVTHAGQAQMRQEWTHQMATFLTGRDYLSFLLQLRMRPELHALFDEEKIAQLQAQPGPISILTIRSLFSEQAQSSRERRLWRVLEELIV